MPTYPVLQYFDYSHLPEHLQSISRPFGELAKSVAASTPSHHPQVEKSLDKLLEAKDCAVRAALSK